MPVAAGASCDSSRDNWGFCKDEPSFSLIIVHNLFYAL